MTTSGTTQAVIFDMDGVLIDSEPLHLVTTNDVLERWGHRLTAEENETYLGWNEPRYWTALKARFDLDPPVEELIAARHVRIIELLKEQLPIADGIDRFLRELKDLGLPLAVASGSEREVVEHVLEHGGIRSFFSALATGDEVKHGKPDPEIYHLAALRLGIDPRTCLVFEDAPDGARAAHAAGMRCIRVMTETTRRVDFPEVETVIEGFTGVRAADLVTTSERSAS